MDRSRIGDSHKRPSCLSSSPSDSLTCGGLCHDEHAREDTRSSKRPKQNSGHIPRTFALPSEATLGKISISSSNANIDSLDISPYSYNPGFQALSGPEWLGPFNFGGQQFPEQNVGRADSIVGTSNSYTVTDGTVSPRSISRQEATDANDAALQNTTPALGLPCNEPSDFGPDSFNSWWDELFWGLETPGNPNAFGFSAFPQLATGVGENEYSFTDRHIENQLSELSCTLTAASSYASDVGSNGQPWSPPLAVENTAFNSSQDEHSHQMATNAKTPQPAIHRDFKFKAIQPLRRRFTTPPSVPLKISTDLRPASMIQSPPKLSKGPGIRKGKLSTSQATQAAKVRQNQACFLCRLLKVPCSVDTPCDRCIKTPHFLAPSLIQDSSLSLSTIAVCFRPRLAECMNLMFPEIVTLRFEEEQIAALLKKNADFTGNQVPVEVSSGPGYAPISLIATEFVCLDKSFLALEYVIPVKDTENEHQTYTTSYSPPLGLCGVRPGELRDKCRAHINSTICEERDIGEVNHGDISLITHKVLEAVNSYRKSTPGGGSTLLTKAVTIYAMHYFMSRIITLSRTSAEVAVKNLQKPQQLPFDGVSQDSPVLTSILLNLQVKQAMLSLLKETTTEVLETFQKNFWKNFWKKRNDSTQWTDNFCVVLILCMCFEAEQVSNDAIIARLLQNNPKSSHDRTDTFLRLENGPFINLMCFFHEAYKTRKAKGPFRRGGFNPVRYGFPIGTGEETTPQMRTLVNEIKNIMALNGEKLAAANQTPSFDNPKPDILTHHMAFRKRNSGRLVSRFLMSFLQ